MNPIVISNIIGPRLSENNIEFKYSKDATNKRIDLDRNREWSDAIINNKKKLPIKHFSQAHRKLRFFFISRSVVSSTTSLNIIELYRHHCSIVLLLLFVCVCVCISNYYHRKIVNLNSVRD
ncbi:hypothetical protein NH340_JMT05977 [Sarcoptes scabiei]|nr:hypothetical protein NH340_JMT05977 [Sarcoptes scabiei]